MDGSRRIEFFIGGRIQAAFLGEQRLQIEFVLTTRSTRNHTETNLELRYLDLDSPTKESLNFIDERRDPATDWHFFIFNQGRRDRCGISVGASWDYGSLASGEAWHPRHT